MTGYTQLTSDLKNLLVDTGSTDFTNILPTMINYAEMRIYQKMNFLYTRKSDSSLTFTANSRNITIPSTMIIVEGISAITPSPDQPNAGKRNPLERASLDFIDMAFPSETLTTGVPSFYSMKDATTAVVGTTPDAAYVAEFTGIFRPTPLSGSNQDTYITLNYYDLMVAACMVFGAGWQKDFGSQADDPRMAQSWESQYQTLEQIAMSEEVRRKSWGDHGTSFIMPPPMQGK